MRVCHFRHDSEGKLVVPTGRTPAPAKALEGCHPDAENAILSVDLRLRTGWDASDSWGDLHRTGASRLGVDQKIRLAIGYRLAVSAWRICQFIRLSTDRVSG